jgi:hypothetical protein
VAGAAALLTVLLLTPLLPIVWPLHVTIGPYTFAAFAVSIHGADYLLPPPGAHVSNQPAGTAFTVRRGDTFYAVGLTRK